ncbi:uncharacterized protein V1518DRAFT_321185 [Limtongia smithiae]|uniref:uncharacterized protein n=1 Tax=Limtongia smithiae TaxID=1125753 RepID=UPI0034CF19E3
MEELDRFNKTDWRYIFSEECKGIDVELLEEVHFLDTDDFDGHYIELGTTALSTGSYEVAYSLLTMGLEWNHAQLKTTDFARTLNMRGTAAIACGAAKFALLDAYQMCWTDGDSVKSYDFAAECCDQLGDVRATRYFMTRISRLGKIIADREVSDEPTTEDSSAKQMLCLPQELWILIADQLPGLNRYPLMEVSKGIREMMQVSLRKLRLLDLRESRWPVPYEMLVDILEYCNDSLEELVVGNLVLSDLKRIAELLRGVPLLRSSSGRPSGRVRECKSHPRLPNLVSLTMLHPNFALDYLLFSPEVPEHLVMLKQFERLRKLVVPVDEPRDIVETIMLGDFPNLEELELRLQYDTARMRSLISVFSELMTTYRHPMLKVLRIGGSPYQEDEYGFPYQQYNDRAVISAALIAFLVRMSPSLREFRCTYMIMHPDLQYYAPQLPMHLDFATMTPNLEILDLSWTSLEDCYVQVPAGCRQVNVQHTCAGEWADMEEMSRKWCVLRRCKTEGGEQWYETYEDPIFPTFHMAPQPADEMEFSALEELNMAWCEAGTDYIVDLLARCDGERLRRLNLHYSRNLEFSTGACDNADSVAQSTSYRPGSAAWSTAKGMRFLDFVARAFRRLEFLAVGYNLGLGDAELESALGIARGLRCVDVSGATSLTTEGLIVAVRGAGSQLAEVVVYNSPQLDGEELRQAVPHVRWRGTST